MKMKDNRRAFLRGAGSIAIALPVAEFCLDRTDSGKLFAQENAAQTARLVTMYFPNGAQAEIWNFEKALSPLADVRDKIILLQNVYNSVTKVNANGEASDGDDGHEQGAAALFTGSRLLNNQKGTSISMDQWLSRRIDAETALKRPLVVGVWRGWAGGEWRSPTWYRRSWMENGDPVTPMTKPHEIFKTIFGDQSSVEEKKIKLDRQKSILDTVVEQYKSQISVNSKLPASHKDLLSAHLEGIRGLEKRIADARSDAALQCVVPKEGPARIDFDSSNLLPYSEFDRVYQLQIDLMVLALQCGSTRTGSMMFCCAGEEYVNPAVSSTHTDHGTSHYGTPAEGEIYLAYRRYHAGNLRKMMEKLKAVGLLDTTTIVYGSEFGDGRPHQVSPQPVLIAGGGINLKMGQVIDTAQGKHTANDIWSTVLTGIGHKTERFGSAEFNTTQIKAIFRA